MHPPHPSVLQAVKILENLSVDQFEIYFERKSATSLQVRQGEVEKLTQAEDAGLAFRVIRDGKLGFSFTTSLLPQAIETAIRAAVEISKFMPPHEGGRLQSFGTEIYPAVDLLDARGLAVPLAEKIELARTLERETRAADPRITGFRECGYSESRREVCLIDSEGEQIAYEGSHFSASIQCKGEANGDAQSGYAYGSARFFDRLDRKLVMQDAVRSATELLGAGPAKTAVMPAVLRHDVVVELLEFLSESFSAESIVKKQSLLAGPDGPRIGEKLFSEKVTLVDDALYPEGAASVPFDGEGVPSRAITLVSEGFFSGILCDTYYGAQLGKPSTGSACRSLKTPPSISASNLYLKPGKPSFDKLIASTGDGILITSLMGLHTANPITGDFSLGATGIMIRGGKLAEPVRGFAVAGNILELLKSVDEVGGDLRFHGSLGAPSIRVNALSIGGSA